MNNQIRLAIFLILTLPALNACSPSKASDQSSTISDSSASGAAAGAVGGALSNSGANGSQARMSFQLPTSFWASVQHALSPLPKAMASQFCPTFRTSGSGCSASGSEMWLTYDDCTYTGRAEWSGFQALTMSSGPASCGSFPNPGANGMLYRQYVTASGGNVPGQVTLMSDNNSGLVDDGTANLGNFDGDAIGTIANGGYGVAVTFDALGTRSQIEIGHHVAVLGRFDHSVTGTLGITEAVGATSRTVNGTVTVYHNLLQVVGTSTFNDVVHENICCLPIGGTITTAFTAGNNVAPTVLGAKLVGKSETLAFTGCGTATLTNTDGSVQNVTLNRCF